MRERPWVWSLLGVAAVILGFALLSSRHDDSIRASGPAWRYGVLGADIGPGWETVTYQEFDGSVIGSVWFSQAKPEFYFQINQLVDAGGDPGKQLTAWKYRSGLLYATGGPRDGDPRSGLLNVLGQVHVLASTEGALQLFDHYRAKATRSPVRNQHEGPSVGDRWAIFELEPDRGKNELLAHFTVVFVRGGVVESLAMTGRAGVFDVEQAVTVARIADDKILGKRESVSTPLAPLPPGLETPAPQPSWVNRDGDTLPPEVLAEGQGPTHCGWQSVSFISLAHVNYVKDRFNILFDHPGQEPFRNVGELPPTAEDTGYRSGNRRLYRSGSVTDDAIYLIAYGRIERWPRFIGGCA